MNMDKVTTGRKSINSVRVPDTLLALDFAALSARIEATGDVAGRELVAAQRERIGRATCTPCARNAATATLRVWLSKREKDNA
jgi:hypothetical protein